MRTQIKLLLLEDDPLDAELNITELEEGGYECDWKRVEMKDEFLAALKKPDYDLILIDYNLPAFDGLSALHILRDYDLNIPAILVSGNLGEELAIESIKAGAVDYVHKDRLHRLVPSIKRALEENKLHCIEKMQANNLALFNKLNQAANSGFSISELIEVLAVETSHHNDYFGATVFLLDESQEYFKMQYLALPMTMRRKIEKLIKRSIPPVHIKVDDLRVMQEVVENKQIKFLDTHKNIDKFIVDITQRAMPKNFPTPFNQLAGFVRKSLSLKAIALLPLSIGNHNIGILAFPSKESISPHNIHRMKTIAEQLTEIFARKLAEEKLAEIQHQQQLILDSTGEGIFGLDIEGRHTFVNPTAAVILGYSPAEMLGKHSHNLFHHTKADGMPCLKAECPIYETYNNGENIYQGETIFWHKDGHSFPVLYSSAAIEEDGKRVGAVITFQDISKQVENTREIARLAEVVKQASITVAITNLEGNLVYVNPFFEKSSGFSTEEVLGENPRVLKSDQQDNTFYKDLWDSITGGETWQNTFINKRKDGSLYYEDASVFPIKTEKGEIINYAAVKRDITAEVEANKALKEEKDFSERIINTSNAIIIGLDKNHLVTLFNKGAETITGYKNDEVLGKDWFSLSFKPEVEEEMNAVWKDAWNIESHSYINPIWAKNGEKRIVSWQSTRLYREANEEKQILLSIGEDITERKEAEKNIRLQLSRLDSLHSIDIEILSNIDLHATLDVVLEQVRKGLEVDASNILLFNSSLQSLQSATQTGFKTDKITRKELRLGKGLAGKTALERKTVYIKDLREENDAVVESPELLSENFISYFGVPLLAQGKLKGVLEIFHRAPLNPDNEWLKFLDMLAGQAAIAIENVSLFETLQKNNMELRLAYETTLEGWARALELRDVETFGHSRRVTALTTELATAIGVDRRLIDHIRRGALLHDIGKMGVPDAILLKNGPLTKEERKEMQKHPTYAYEMLKNIIFLKPALDIPYSHHEKWDGTGYPLGIRGAAIPLSARIFSVIDVYDALRHDRHYRKAWSEENTLAYIREGSGTYFDPQIVEVFLKIIAEKSGD